MARTFPEDRVSPSGARLSRRRILIAGGRGFHGQALTRSLREQGARVCWLVRRRVRTPDGVRLLVWSESPSAAWRRESFTDLVIATGTHRTSVARQEASDLFQSHVAVPLQLTEWAVQRGVRHVVHLSSASVYHAEGLPPTGVPKRPAPELYASMKLAAECLLAPFRDRAFIQVLRLFRPYGPGPEHTTVNRILGSIWRGETVEIGAPDGIVVQPVFIGDVCRAVSTALGVEKSFSVDLAGKERLSLGALIRRWIDLTGSRGTFRVSKRRDPNDPPASESGVAGVDAAIATPLGRGLAIMKAFFNSNHARTGS